MAVIDNQNLQNIELVEHSGNRADPEEATQLEGDGGTAFIQNKPGCPIQISTPPGRALDVRIIPGVFDTSNKTDKTPFILGVERVTMTGGVFSEDIVAAGQAASMAISAKRHLLTNLYAADVALGADNTSELKVSIYGKSSAAGDTPIKVEATGEPDIILKGLYGAAVTTVPLDVNGYLPINVMSDVGQKVDKAAFSLGSDKVCMSGGVFSEDTVTSGQAAAISISAKRHVLSNLYIADVALGADNTSELKVSAYGKSSAAGDTPIKVEATGEPDIILKGLYGAAVTTVPLDVNGYLPINVMSDVGQKVDKAAFSLGSDKVSMSGGVFSEDTVTSGQAAAISISAKRHVLANLYIADVALGADNTSELKVSAYGKSSAAGDTPIKLEATGEVDTILKGLYGAAVTTVPLDVNGYLPINVMSDVGQKVDKAAFSLGSDKVCMSGGVFSEDTVTSGQAAAISISAKRHVLSNLYIADVALGADNTSELKVSAYGKSSAAGDTPIKVEATGEVDTVLKGLYGAAVTTVPLDVNGYIPINVMSDVGQKVDKAAFSLGSDKVCMSGGVFSEDTVTSGQAAAVSISAKRHVLANLYIADVALGADNTSELKVSIYGKSSAAGDTPISTDATGRVNVMNRYTVAAAAALPGYLAMVGASDGTNGQYLKVGASGELQVTDIAIRPGENASDNTVHVTKSICASYSPSKTTSASFTTQVVILASVDLLGYPNIVLTVKNTGPNAFTEGTIWTSPDGTSWESLDAVTFGTLGAGVIKSYHAATQSFRYYKITATAGTATTADVWVTANAA